MRTGRRIQSSHKLPSIVDCLVSDQPPIRWKYTLYLAINANFQLVCLVVSNLNRDPSLINGAGFIVRQEDFHAHIAEYGKRIHLIPATVEITRPLNWRPQSGVQDWQQVALGLWIVLAMTARTPAPSRYWIMARSKTSSIYFNHTKY